MSDPIKIGTTYSISVHVNDDNGDRVTLTSEWSCMCRLSMDECGKKIVGDYNLALVDNQFVVSLDTGSAPFKVGTYYFDVRTTDPDGNDEWSDTITLTLEARITPPSPA